MRTSKYGIQIPEQDDFLSVMTCSVAITFRNPRVAGPFADYDDMVDIDLSERSIDDFAGDCLSWYKCAKGTFWRGVHDDVNMLGGVFTHSG